MFVVGGFMAYLNQLLWKISQWLQSAKGVTGEIGRSLWRFC